MRVRQIHGAIEHQHVAAVLEFRNMLAASLHQDDIAGPQQDVFKITADLARRATRPVNSQRKQSVACTELAGVQRALMQRRSRRHHDLCNLLIGARGRQIIRTALIALLDTVHVDAQESFEFLEILGCITDAEPVAFPQDK